MGAKCSSFNGIDSNEYLVKLCAPVPLSVNDPVWNAVFSYGLPIPISRKEHEAAVLATANLFTNLQSTDSTTRNATTLLKQFLIRATELKASAQCEDKIFIWQTCNALFVLRMMLSHWVHAECEAELVKRFTVKSDDGGQSEGLLDNLAVQLVEILVDVPLKEETALLHMEAVQTLLLLVYSAATAYMTDNKSVLLKCLMNGRGALHAGLLTRTLLQHYCLQQPVPVDWLRKRDTGGSIIIGLASGLWNMLSRSSAPAGEATAGAGGSSEFAAQSLLLLLVLTNHCTVDSASGWSNPYRQSLLSFTDSQDPVQVSPVHPGACFRLDYSVVYATVCDHLDDERTTLLLYVLLHQHQQFRLYVYTNADIQRMVLALLQVLYAGDNQASHHLYMSLIILLLLTEDEGFNSNVHNITVRNPMWYTERVLNEISLGGLVVLVIIRTIQRNIIKASDKYLHTNCLAALANMAAHFRRLHSYVCERLLSLLCVLNKRRLRLIQQLKSAAAASATSAEDKTTLEDLELDLSTVDEVLRMLLEILNATFSHQLSSNQHLVYSMLHKREVLDVLRRQDTFQDVVANLDTVANYFSTKIAKLSEPGVTDILHTIHTTSGDFSKVELKKFPELKFRYVEEEQPESFFVPYVWSMVHGASTLFWLNENTPAGRENGNPC